jgi:hypothetical protein
MVGYASANQLCLFKEIVPRRVPFCAGHKRDRLGKRWCNAIYPVFATATASVPFDPAGNRIVVEFKDGGGVVRGSMSVAVRTQ